MPYAYLLLQYYEQINADKDDLLLSKNVHEPFASTIKLSV